MRDGVITGADTCRDLGRQDGLVPLRWRLLFERGVFPSGGTNVRRRRLQPSTFLRYKTPAPPMTAQLKLREVFQRTQALSAKHAATRAANAALLPATLERVFAGHA
jgi:hypothetical protein